ncbi:hypothetical protein FACS1894110_23240 [Spirochaetia bacterium]|nr:hypothetical protein FACS1894110_23240 [Spirochaetia bacterium]
MKYLVLLTFALLSSVLYAQNYYEVPYVGGNSKLEEITGAEKERIISRYTIPRRVDNFLDYRKIDSDLKTIYRETVPDETGRAALTVYRVMYDLASKTSSNFNEDDNTVRETYGQALYILNPKNQAVKLFARTLYFSDAAYLGNDRASGVNGGNYCFRISGNTIIFISYGLIAYHHESGMDEESYGSEFIQSQSAEVFRCTFDKLFEEMEKTVDSYNSYKDIKLCSISAPFPLLDRNNPFRYSIQNAFDGSPATSYVGDTEDRLFDINISFTTPNRCTKIAVINGYAQSEQLYSANNRISAIGYGVRKEGNGNRLTYISSALKDKYMEMQVIDAMEAQTRTTCALEIQSYFPGNKYDDTCLAELNLFDDNSGWLFGDIY